MTSNGFILVCRVLLLLFISKDVFGDSEKSSTAEEENLNKLATANNDLAFNLYSKLASEKSGNVFFSPLSLSDALGMLFIGTRGNTQEELRNALGYNAANLTNDQVPLAYNSYLDKVLSANKNYTLDLANKILIKNDFEINPTYMQEVQNDFKADIEKVNFEKNADQIKNEVNSWVSKKTHGKIDSVLQHVDPSTVMLLLNAIYFKGIWKTTFDKKYTKPRKFYENGLDSEARDVPFMDTVSSKPFRYAEVDGNQVLELPYKGEDISMIIIKPFVRNGLSNLEKTLTVEKFKEFQNELGFNYVYVKIPIFKIVYAQEMVREFEALGAKQVFTGAADFSGMSPNKGIEASSIFHKAIIEVNEEGSTAAAVTAIRIVPASPGPPIFDPEFTADHPFIFAIVDKRNGMILFMGRLKEI